MKGAAIMVGTAGVAGALMSLVAVGEPGGGPTRRPDEVPVVVAAGPEAVSRLVVEGEGERAELTQPIAGIWHRGPGTPEASEGLIAELEDELFPLRAYRSLRADPSREEFGLGNAHLVARVHDRRGGQVRLAVGAETFTRGGFYAQRNGDARLYLLTRRSVDGLRSIMRGEAMEAIRPAGEAEALARAGALTDEETITNPWLGQVLDEVP